jgi:hypothetical protein
MHVPLSIMAKRASFVVEIIFAEMAGSTYNRRLGVVHGIPGLKGP